MLSDEWLSRYELLKNLHIKLCRSVTGTRTTRVTTIALLVLRTGELKNLIFFISQLPVFVSSFDKSESVIPSLDKSAKTCCRPIFLSNFDQVPRYI